MADTGAPKSDEDPWLTVQQVSKELRRSRSDGPNVDLNETPRGLPPGAPPAAGPSL